jgi:hypothetical protein
LFAGSPVPLFNQRSPSSPLRCITLKSLSASTCARLPLHDTAATRNCNQIIVIHAPDSASLNLVMEVELPPHRPLLKPKHNSAFEE